jgi:hypothetical protein
VLLERAFAALRRIGTAVGMAVGLATVTGRPLGALSFGKAESSNAVSLNSTRATRRAQHICEELIGKIDDLGRDIDPSAFPPASAPAGDGPF